MAEPLLASAPAVTGLAPAAVRARVSGRDALPAQDKPGLRAAYVRTVQRDASAAYAARPAATDAAEARFEARNEAQDLALRFERRGVVLARTGAGTSGERRFALRLSLLGVGRGGKLGGLAHAGAPRADGNRVEYGRSRGVTEWYVNGPLGLEQGFTLAERPTGQAPLTLAVGVGEQLRPRLTADGRVVELAVAGARGGSAVLRYGELYVEDARGQQVPSRLSVDDGRIIVTIEDQGASYPLVVDPLVWVETRLDRPGDVEAEDWFGNAIAADGDVAVITSQRGNDALGVGTGAAYVFERAAKRWALKQKLAPTDGVVDHGFGTAVAIDGDTILVGQLPLGFGNSGAAYVYLYDGFQWDETQKLEPAMDDGSSDFGLEVALDGAEAFVGAQREGAGGAVYRFVRSGDTFTEAQTILPSDPELNAVFGCAIAIHDDTLVIGAYADDELATNSGAAYVFIRDGALFRQRQKLSASTGAMQDTFGIDLALDGDTLLVGAMNHAPSGAVYVFERTNGPFVEAQTLTGSGLDAGSNFGLGIDIEGDTALIGAPFHANSGAAFVFQRGPSGFVERERLLPADAPDDGRMGRSVALAGETAIATAFFDSSLALRAGSAYTFEREGSDWLQAQKLEPNVAHEDHFGLRMDVSGETVIVGADQDDQLATYAGKAYVFTRDGGAWTIEDELFAADGAANDNFGTSVAIDGDTALIGAWARTETHSNQGAAYVFVRSGTSWTQQAKLLSSMPASVARFGAQVALDGDTAVVSENGSTPRLFVFTRSGVDWGAPQVLLAPSGTHPGSFSIDGDTIVHSPVGGTTRVYTRSAGTFAFSQTLPEGGDVSIDGDTIAVGFLDEDELHLGEVFVYTRSGGSFSSAGTVTPPPGTLRAHSWGQQAAVSGDTLLVAAQGIYDGSVAYAGGGYVYTRTAIGSPFALVQFLKPSYPKWTNQVGISAEIDGQIAVLGGFDQAFVFEGVDPGANGDECYLDQECQNAHCVEGICCNTACDGACEACSQIEKANGTADGSCGLVASGTRCGDAPTGCASATAYRTAPTCTAGGACQQNSATCANSFACVGSASDGLCVTTCLNQGVPDHGYCAGSHYCSAGTCVPDEDAGSPCSVSAQCESNTCVGSVCLGRIGDACGATTCAQGFCVDGHCCSTICNGTCEACGESGQQGTCVAVTGAPRGSRTPCVAHASCGGSCNGVTRNACTYPGSATSCGTPVCGAGQLTEHHCNGGGTCVADTPESCAPYVNCADGQSCDASCDNDADCASSHFCDSVTDTCSPDRMQAQSCSRDGQCLTGNCADGVCCNDDCGEQCEACNEAGTVGTCVAVTGAPRGSRAACAGGGTDCAGACDGATRDGCLYPAATSCGSSTCNLGIAYGALCNGLGACVTNNVGQSCFPYAACADGTECLASCNGQAQCVSGYFCDTASTPDVCAMKRGDGEACDSAVQCANGFCVDGVCCNTECTGQCEACAEPSDVGTCVPVEGEPRGGRAACAGSDDDDNACAGSCGGTQRDGCDFPMQGTACAEASCDGAVLTPARVCDGAGACGQESTQDCGAYACDADDNSCNTRCESRDDCAAGALCRLDVRQCAFVPSVCIDGFTIELADGTQSSCDGHRCSGGECQEICGDDDDCAPSYACVEDDCVRDESVPEPPPPDAGPSAPDAGRDAGAMPEPPDAGTSEGGSGGSPPPVDLDAGHTFAPPSKDCGCRAPGAASGASGPTPMPLLALGGLVLLRLHRRRRL